MAKTLWRHIIILCSVCLLFLHKAHAQRGPNDSLMLGAVVVGPDTFAMVYLDNVVIKDKMLRKWARKRAQYDKLRYNVYKVYPYAVMAADVLKDVDSNLLAIGDDKSATAA